MDTPKEPPSSLSPFGWGCSDNREHTDLVWGGSGCQVAPGQGSGTERTRARDPQQVQTPYKAPEQPAARRLSQLNQNTHSWTLALVITPTFSVHPTLLAAPSPALERPGLPRAKRHLLAWPSTGRSLCPDRRNLPAEDKEPGGLSSSSPTQTLLPALLGAGRKAARSAPGLATRETAQALRALPPAGTTQEPSVGLTFIYTIDCTARFPVTLARGGSATLISHTHELTISGGEEEAPSGSWVLQGHT